MDSLKLVQKQRNIFFLISLGIIIVAGFLNIRILLGRLTYNRAFGYLRPASLVGRKEYYRDKLSAIEKAISFVPDKARYYSFYAEAASSALSDNLGEELDIDKEKTEKLYKKAIELNPTNFLYHTRLGGFYRRQQDERAEEKLLEAYKIYPTYTGYTIGRELAHLYLERTEKYLKEDNAFGAFRNLILFIYYSYGKEVYRLRRQRQRRYPETKGAIIKMADKINVLAGLEADLRRRNLKYEAKPLSSDYDFGAEGFPPLQVELAFRVYLDNRDDQVFLYKRFRPYGHFEYVAEEDGFFVYEYVLRDYPEGAYLDDFRIQTENYSLLEKIEIIKSFRL